MFLFFGIGSKQQIMGYFFAPCIYCNTRHSMMLTKQYQYFHLFFIPLFHFHTEYYLSCPDCSALYLLNKQKAEQLCRNPETVVDAADMNTVGRGIRYCNACGAQIRDGDAFCPKCGHRL